METTERMTRAIDRARGYAKRVARPVYIYATKRGLAIDTARPTLDQFTMVTPDGAAMKGKQKW